VAADFSVLDDALNARLRAGEQWRAQVAEHDPAFMQRIHFFGERPQSGGSTDLTLG
jgi:hypothetical protein